MSLQEEIFSAKVNSLIGCLFVGSFALGAALIIWTTAHNENPLEKVFLKYLTDCTYMC